MRLGISTFVVTVSLATVFGCSSSTPASSGAAGSGGSAGLVGVAGSVGSAGTNTAAGGSGTAGAGAAGAPVGTAGSDSGIPPTFATVKLVFGGGGGITACNSAPCHGSGSVSPPPPSMALTLADDDMLYAHVTTYVSQGCGGIPLVKPGDANGSALVKILSGPCSATTPQMPDGCVVADGTCIPADYVAAVAQWINNGALQQ